MRKIQKIIILTILCLVIIFTASSGVFEVKSASNIIEDDVIFDREKEPADSLKIKWEYSDILSNTDFKSSSKPLEFSEYNNTTYNYSFHYPSSWKIDNLPNNLFPYLRIENFDSSEIQDKKTREKYEQYFKIEVVILPNDKNLTLSEWVKELVNTSYPSPQIVEQKYIQIAGLPAIYQLEQVGSFVHPVAYVQKDEKIYLINISSVAKKFEPIIRNFLESFSFNL